MNTESKGNLFVLSLPECSGNLLLAQQAASWASPEKQMKRDSYTCKAEYERSLFGEMLVRTALSRMTGIAPKKLQITRGAFGKPQLQSNAQLCFNLSHSGDYAVCAVSHAECGVDTEKIRAARPGFANRFFHPFEVAFLDALPPEQYDEYLCRIWTLKEAYVKYLGCGLQQDISAFSFADEHRRFVTHSFAPELSFQQFTLPDGYILSVCGEELFQHPVFIRPESIPEGWRSV